MSIQRLQDKIRKAKNPTILDFGITAQQLPPHLRASEGSFLKAYTRFCMELMDGLRGNIPAVKFSFSTLALMGTEGTVTLIRLLEYAKKSGFYTVLEVPEALSYQQAQIQADSLLAEDSLWPCDGIVLSAYIGTDGIKPYAAKLQDSGKSLFVAVRTANRSAPELQDLLAGGRNVFDAKADLINRFKNPQAGKNGYDNIALVGPASSPAVLRRLRDKYKNLFILVDGYDYPNANAKNCAEAADQLGHGVVVCGGTGITGAWQLAGNNGTEYVRDAVDAALRMKKNLARYFTVL